MLPLLAALGLMGGARAGGEWWRRQQEQSDADASSSKIKDLLGAAPGLMYPGGPDEAGPPEQTPGSGLMADPYDTRRQLAFTQGLMSLRPEERGAAGKLFEGILGRAQTQAGEREQLAQQSRQFESSQGGINARFEAQQQQARDEFQQNATRYGEKFALEKLKHDQDMLRGRQELELNALKIAAAKAPGSDVSLGAVPAGTARVMGPEGPEDVPLRGSEAWRKEYNSQEGIVSAYQNLDELDKLVESHGTEVGGKSSAAMKFRHARVVSALAALESSGRYNENQMKDLREQIGDPTGWSSMGKRTSTLREGYDQMRKFLRDEYNKAQGRTRGWQGFGTGASLEQRAAGEEANFQAAGRRAPAPPRGTVPYTGARPGPMW